MKKELNEVARIVEEASALQVEKLARVLFLKKNKQMGYTQDQIGTMTQVLKHELRINEIDEISYEATKKIIDILNEVYPGWESEVQAVGGFSGFLESKGIEVKKVTEDEQKVISNDAIGRKLTISQIAEELERY